MEISAKFETEATLFSKIDRVKMAKKIMSMASNGNRSISVGQSRMFFTEGTTINEIYKKVQENNVEGAISLALTSLRNGNVVIQTRKLNGERHAVTTNKCAKLIKEGGLILKNKQGDRKEFTSLTEVRDEAFSNLAKDMSENLAVSLDEPKKEEKKNEEQGTRTTSIPQIKDVKKEASKNPEIPSKKDDSENKAVAATSQLKSEPKEAKQFEESIEEAKEAQQLLETEEQQAADQRRELNKKEDEKTDAIKTETTRVKQSIAQDEHVDVRSADLVLQDALSDEQLHKEQKEIRGEEIPTNKADLVT